MKVLFFSYVFLLGIIVSVTQWTSNVEQNVKPSASHEHVSGRFPAAFNKRKNLENQQLQQEFREYHGIDKLPELELRQKRLEQRIKVALKHSPEKEELKSRAEKNKAEIKRLQKIDKKCSRSKCYLTDYRVELPFSRSVRRSDEIHQKDYAPESKKESDSPSAASAITNSSTDFKEEAKESGTIGQVATISSPKEEKVELEEIEKSLASILKEKGVQVDPKKITEWANAMQSIDVPQKVEGLSPLAEEIRKALFGDENSLSLATIAAINDMAQTIEQSQKQNAESVAAADKTDPNNCVECAKKKIVDEQMQKILQSAKIEELAQMLVQQNGAQESAAKAPESFSQVPPQALQSVMEMRLKLQAYHSGFKNPAFGPDVVSAFSAQNRLPLPPGYNSFQTLTGDVTNINNYFMGSWTPLAPAPMTANIPTAAPAPAVNPVGPEIPNRQTAMPTFQVQ